MEYNKITPELVEELRKRVSCKVLTGEDISPDYAKDEMPTSKQCFPDAVVEATCEEDVVETLKFCNEHKIVLIPRGAGSGLSGNSVALYGGVMLATSKMNKIKNINPNRLTATIEPGVTLNDLYDAAAPYGLMYAPAPGIKTACIGGNINTNAGGMKAVKYGSTRKSIWQLRVALVTGEVITVGAPVNKNSSGYSLLDLIIGSEGTLGVVTEATVMLQPEPGSAISMIIPYADILTAIKSVPLFKMKHFAPQSIELISKQTVIDVDAYTKKTIFPRNVEGVEPEGYLLVTIEGTDEEDCMNTVMKAAEMVVENGALDVLVIDDPRLKRELWEYRDSFQEATYTSVKNLRECDVVVPVDVQAEYIEYCDNVAKELGVLFLYAGHAGDGNIHVHCATHDLEEDEFLRRKDIFMQKAYDKAFSLGGTVSGEHGIGHEMMPYLLQQVGETQMELMRAIKKAFDPNMILNPGKVCFDPEDPRFQ